MNLELKKWNPFKFLRNRNDDSQSVANADREKAGADGTPVQKRPANWPDMSPPLLNDPFRAIAELMREPFGFGELDRWFGDFSSSRFQPRIDAVDDGEALRFTAELPGMDRDDLQVSVEGGMLVLRGEKMQDVRSEESGCYRLERSYGKFTRSIPLPDEIDLDRADAKFEKGVLSLSIPKTAPARSSARKIEVK